MKFRVKHCVIRIHPLLFTLVFTALILGQFSILLSSVLALCLHECGHLLIAAGYHIPIQEFMISPMGGTINCDTQSLTRIKRILFSLSGPIASLLGYLLCYTVLQNTHIHVVFWLDALRFNLLLLLINLLPVLPLDGGYCLLAIFHNASTCRRLLSALGFLTGCLLISLSLYFAWQKHLILSPAFAGCFLLYSASMEKRSTAARCIHRMLSFDLQLRKHRLLPLCSFAACENMTLFQAAAQLPDNRFASLIVLSENDFSELGTLSAHTFSDALLTDSHMTLGQALAKKER